jgi:hypothetical protein
MTRPPPSRMLPLLVGAGLALLPYPALAQSATPSLLADTTATSPSASETPEARLARRIARALEAGRVEEARIDAEAGAKRYPEDALLRRRRAQVKLCLAIQLDGQLAQAVEDAAFAQALPNGVKFLREEPQLRPDEPSDPEELERRRRERTAAREKLLTPAALDAITRFQEQARQQLAESGSLLERRSHVLREALADLKEARRLGDDSVEAALTDLWAQALPLFWRQERDELTRSAAVNAGKPKASETPTSTRTPEAPPEPDVVPLAGLEKAIAEFSALTPDAVLRAAAALAKQHTSDPAALAGVADLISVVSLVKKTPDPLRSHLMAVVDHRYLKHPEWYSVHPSPAVREAYRQRYLQARDAGSPDVVSAPWAVTLQLYEKALQQDPDGTLSHLRLRLYLLRVAFDREGAAALLEELGQREPRNAVVPLERARLAFTLDDKPAEGLAFMREAARLTEFSRSYLVAVPAVLRPTLKFHRGLRQIVEQGRPGYRVLFTTLMDIQVTRHAQGSQWKLDPQQATAAEREMPPLRLKLADRLCQAPDYLDQALGVHEKALVLSHMLESAEELPLSQRTVFLRLLEEHRRTFNDYPRSRSFLTLTMNGLGYLGVPNLDRQAEALEGPQLWISPRGAILSDFVKPRKK